MSTSQPYEPSEPGPDPQAGSWRDPSPGFGTSPTIGPPAPPGSDPPPGATPPGPPPGPLGEPADAPTGPPPRRGFHVPWWLSSVVFAVLLALLLHQFVLQSFSIPSGSMEPTLKVGDRVLVDKLAYDLHGVHRGDIVVFRKPPDEDCGDTGVKYLVKRVIGLPGQTISSSSSGQVLIDGQPITEGYLPKPDPLGRAIPKTVIPSGYYYMLGDNRDDSCDSRYWGPLQGSLIVGKVDARTWPLSRIHWF